MRIPQYVWYQQVQKGKSILSAQVQPYFKLVRLSGVLKILQDYSCPFLLDNFRVFHFRVQLQLNN